MTRTAPHEHTRLIVPPSAWGGFAGAASTPLPAPAPSVMTGRDAQAQPPPDASVPEHLQHVAYRAEGVHQDLVHLGALVPGRAAEGLISKIKMEVDYLVSIFSGGLAPLWRSRTVFESRKFPCPGWTDHANSAEEVVRATHAAFDALKADRAPGLKSQRRYDCVMALKRARWAAHNLASCFEPSGAVFTPPELSPAWGAALMGELPVKRPHR